MTNENTSQFVLSSELQVMLINTADMFVQLFVELTFLFLVISYIVALINKKLPAEKIQKLLGGRNGRGYLTAVGLGAVTPASCLSNGGLYHGSNGWLYIKYSVWLIGVVESFKL